MTRYRVTIYLTPGVDGFPEVCRDFDEEKAARALAIDVAGGLEVLEERGWYIPRHRINAVRVREIVSAEATDGDEPGADDHAGGAGVGAERGPDPGANGGAAAGAAGRGRPRGPKGPRR